MEFTFSKIVRQVLNESFQDFEYHFTSLDNLVRICQTGRIPLSHTYAKGAEIGINKNHTFYLSLTRVKDGRVGYSKPYNCRICFNGKALATRFKGEAVNYWNGLGDKRQYYKNLVTRREINPDGTKGRELDKYEDLKPGVKYDVQYKNFYKDADPYNYSEDMQAQTSTENEDRLLTNEPFIDHIEKFVTSIDILYVKNENQKYDDATKKKISACLRSKYRNLVRVYDNDKDFNFGTKNIVNKEFEYDGELYMEENPESTEGTDLRNNFNALKDIMDIFLYVDCFNKKNNEKATYIKKKLESYNLGAYSRFISAIIKNSQRFRYVMANDINAKFEDAMTRLTNTRSQDSQYISKMVGDWMREHGFKRAYDIYTNLQSRYQDIDDKDIDFQKQITFLTYRNVYIIPDPSHTDFWQITEADNFDKEDFVNTMIDYVEGSIDGKERNVRGNDTERFRKYLQHLTHKCTVEQMFSLFKKLDIDPSESFSNQWTDFKYKKLNYFDATYMWLPKYTGLSYDQRDKYRKDNEKEITQYYLK